MRLLAKTLPFLLCVPVIAFAQTSGTGGNFTEVEDFFTLVLNFINGTLVPLVFAIAFLVFIWGVVKFFILGGGDETKRSEGKQLMIWGIIGFVVMVSLWGIVNLLSEGLFGNNQELQNIPNVPTNNPS